ncbi:hypothetical protein BJY52DRAFT_168422 [Lactarius psammicola]|nr:hypothetical protein BJY52DRAFT_168422 [Lactarius psammicola]
MESMNIDDISTSFSNLDIAFTAENNGLVAREATIAYTFPKSDGVQRRFPFLSLPWQAKWRVYTHLQSKDCIALSSTCRQMYRFNTFAYTHLQLLPPNSLFSLAHTVCQLGAVLASSPHYAAAVRTIRIVGWTTLDVPEGWDREAVYKALDKGIVGLLEYGRHVYSLTLDLNMTMTLNYFPKTLSALAQVRTIRDLRLTPFFTPTYAAESNPSLDGLLGGEPPAYEQVSLNVYSGGWLPIMMRDPRKLRWFGLSIADKDWQPGDANWALTLRRVAEAATELETLVLSGGQHFDAGILGQTLRIGFSRGVLGRLRSISVDTDALSIVTLTQLFSGFSCSSITHLRVVVNHYGRWLPDFGPQYVMELAKLIPDLEELSLDQKGMPMPAPLPGRLNTWGEVFRMFKKLRRIAFASMFVLDICGPRVTFGDSDEEDEDEEEEPNGQQDTSMDLDESYDGDGDYETNGDEDAVSEKEETLARNIGHLAVWADMFLDEHLRMLPPFGEIWFLDSRFAGNIAAGYNQMVMMGEDGRAEHMIHYPSTRKRDGWWWNDNDPIPLD